jgi:hypothetical protein
MIGLDPAADIEDITVPDGGSNRAGHRSVHSLNRSRSTRFNSFPAVFFGNASTK